MDVNRGVALAITSSTGIMGVAVGRGGVVLASVEIEAERRHAEEIGPMLEGVLDDAGLAMADLDYLVVDIGPGRFTGLRVGLATMRALAFALDVPLVGLTSLEILAAAEKASTVTAVIDARRSEVFQQVFRNGDPVDEAEVGEAGLLAGRAQGVLVGDGVERYWESYTNVDGLDPSKGVEVSVATMLALATGREARPGVEVEPLYLREPDVNPNVKVRPHA